MDRADRDHEYRELYHHYAGGNKYGDHRPIDMLHEKRPGVERAMHDQAYAHRYETLPEGAHHYRERGYYLEAEDDVNFLPPTLIEQGPGAPEQKSEPTKAKKSAPAAPKKVTPAPAKTAPTEAPASKPAEEKTPE